MACLRKKAVIGRVGTFQCDEEGCEFRPLSPEADWAAYGIASPADCVLQLRLRAGDAEESDEFDRNEHRFQMPVIDGRHPFTGEVLDSRLRYHEWTNGRPEDLTHNVFEQGCVFCGSKLCRGGDLCLRSDKGPGSSKKPY